MSAVTWWNKGGRLHPNSQSRSEVECTCRNHVNENPKTVVSTGEVNKFRIGTKGRTVFRVEETLLKDVVEYNQAQRSTNRKSLSRVVNRRRWRTPTIKNTSVQDRGSWPSS